MKNRFVPPLQFPKFPKLDNRDLEKIDPHQRSPKVDELWHKYNPNSPENIKKRKEEKRKERKQWWKEHWIAFASLVIAFISIIISIIALLK